MVPATFLGLSVDSSDLPQLAGASQNGNLVALLRSLGGGVIRIGGNGADDAVAWTPDGVPKPSWAGVAVNPATLGGLAALAGESGWKIILTLNLGHYEPATAADEAATAEQLLGPALAGIAIGNEPEYYMARGLRGPGWGPAEYGAELQAYQGAILAAAPQVSFAGPDSASSDSSWEATYDHVLSPSLITNHYYAIDGCHGRLPAPSLLTESTLKGEARALVAFVSSAELEGRPARMDETNSVSCGGRAPLSDSFESALWAAIYIPQAIRAGESGVNFQLNSRLSRCDGYSPICIPQSGSLRFQARPLWYALLLTRSLAGTYPVRTIVKGKGSVSASAFRTTTGGLRLLLVNRGGRANNVAIRAVGRRLLGGQIIRLLAPSLLATNGVTLGGATVTGQGTWNLGSRIPRARPARGRLLVNLPPYSAALVATATSG